MASDVVYKYRTWNNELHRASLVLRQLFFASPGNLNDPFDFKIRPDFSMLDDLDKITKFANYTVDVFKDDFDEEKLNEAKSSIIKSLSQNPLHYQEKYNADTAKQENDKYGILCLSQVWNNVLMWSHYAENHQGFCLGFYKNKLPLFYNGATIHVDYRPEYPKISPLDPVLRRIKIHFGTKLKAWEYEKEYRIIKMITPSVAGENNRIYTYSNDQLKEVILGMRVPEHIQAEIVSIAKEAKIPVFKIVPKEKTFELGKVQISGVE